MAGAGAPFASYSDPSGDVRRDFGGAGSEPADEPGVDVLAVASEAVDGTVAQRVTFAATMDDGVFLQVTSRVSAADTPKVVVQFRKNVQGAGDGGTVFGADGSTTPIPVDITADGATATFRFAESAIPAGSCFTVSVWAVKPRGSDVNVGTSDEAYPPEPDPCAASASTGTGETPLGTGADGDGGTPPSDDGGDEIPGGGAGLATVAVAAVALARRRRTGARRA